MLETCEKAGKLTSDKVAEQCRRGFPLGSALTAEAAAAPSATPRGRQSTEGSLPLSPSSQVLTAEKFSFPSHVSHIVKFVKALIHNGVREKTQKIYKG